MLCVVSVSHCHVHSVRWSSDTEHSHAVRLWNHYCVVPPELRSCVVSPCCHNVFSSDSLCLSYFGSDDIGQLKHLFCLLSVFMLVEEGSDLICCHDMFSQEVNNWLPSGIHLRSK